MKVEERGSYTVSVTGGPALVGGFDAGFFDSHGAPAGTIVVTDPAGSQLAPGGEITHTRPNHNLSWLFDWVAPPVPGVYTLEVAGLSANGDGSASGDGWAAGSMEVTVTCEPGTVRSCGTDVGECRAETQTCNADGASFGPCVGEIGPTEEVCDGLDNDCDGLVDNDCPGLACSGDPGALRAGPLTMVRKKPARGRLRARCTRLPLPAGLDPAAGPLTYKLESEAGTLFEVSVSLVPKGHKRRRFVYRKGTAGAAPAALGKGSRMVVRRSRSGSVLRLDAVLRGLTLGFEPAAPPPTITQWVRLGTTCFRGKLACHARKHGKLLRCRP